MMSFMALLLIIKMITVKLMYFAPLILGAGAAKKILLKILLFVFPAFAHLFKFCAYYHASHAKFHHHHHQVSQTQSRIINKLGFTIKIKGGRPGWQSG